MPPEEQRDIDKQVSFVIPKRGRQRDIRPVRKYVALAL